MKKIIKLNTNKLSQIIKESIEELNWQAKYNGQEPNIFNKVEFDNNEIPTQDMNYFSPKPGIDSETKTNAINNANKRHYDRLRQRQLDEPEYANNRERLDNEPELQQRVQDFGNQRRLKQQNNFVDPNQLSMDLNETVKRVVRETLNRKLKK